MDNAKILPKLDIKAKLREFIKVNFLLDAELSSINDDDSLLKKGVIDSTGVLELVSFIEETFGFHVEDEELIPDNLDSIDKIVFYVTRKKANAG